MRTQEEMLCGWDFCESCINARIRAKLPIPFLKSDPERKLKPYYRLEHPNWKPSQPRYTNPSR